MTALQDGGGGQEQRLRLGAIAAIPANQEDDVSRCQTTMAITCTFFDLNSFGLKEDRCRIFGYLGGLCSLLIS